ncbi:MAG: PucR family transcriptional regulator ligand-binding domain-containing protein [Nakamurella sp.]
MGVARHIADLVKYERAASCAPRTSLSGTEAQAVGTELASVTAIGVLREGQQVVRTDFPTVAPGITMREVLARPAMVGAIVLAGASGLDRVVRFVNMMEVPDVLQWTKADELLLTTGYPLRSTPEKLDDFVAALDARGLAGIAVKLGRYIDELPKEMLETADRLGFPVVQLADGVGFDEIMNQVLSEVLGRQAAMLARSEQAHSVLLQLVLKGGGLPEVVAALPAQLEGGRIGYPAADQRGSRASGPVSPASKSSTSATHDASRAHASTDDPGDDDPADDDLGTAAVSVLHVDRTGRTIAQAGADLPKAAEELFADDHLFRATMFGHGIHSVGTGKHRVSVLIATVVAERNQGHLIAVRADRPFDGQDVMILERGATVAALVVTRELAVAAVEGKYRGDFLRDVLVGQMPPSAAVDGATGFGWDLTGNMFVVVAAGEVRGGDEALRRRRAEQLGASWAAWVRRWDAHGAAAAFATEAVAVLHAPDGQVPPTARVTELLGGLSSPGTPFDGIVGVSRVVADVSQLSTAYHQAWEAVRVGRRLAGAGSVSRFDDLGLYRLLSQVPDSDELRSFLADTLGPLAAAEGDIESDELRRTLTVLLDTNLNVAQTARRLHFHYNTLRYRIGKLERLLGPFTTDARLRADLTVALYVWQMRIAHR